jgi:hypothetical protein
VNRKTKETVIGSTVKNCGLLVIIKPPLAEEE